jgi:integrase
LVLRLFKYVGKSAKVKNLRFHDLRHSCASLLIDKGANILFVSKQLGHSSVQFTLNTYAHLYPSTEKTVIERLGQPDLTAVAV